MLSGLQAGNPIILKLGLDNEALAREAFALKCFVGCGAVKVLVEANGMLLFERAVPGAFVKSYFPDKEQESIEIACGVMKKLHQANIPEDHTFPHIKDWLTALDKDWNIPNHYLQKAKKLRDELLQTSKLDVLLHGDLRHDNILQNGDDWVVIDPKGVVGEPAYEVADFIRNPRPELLTHADAPNIIHNRVTRFAELLELPSQRILDWCFVQAVLSWVWVIEDGSDAGYFEELIRILEVTTFQFDKQLNIIYKSK
ncbi:MAG: streptomycin phosphotransferase [Gammaproteobacteria bacterium]|nr:streptomycin phosphotransferase [Gammaproteobacteria bacterium]